MHGYIYILPDDLRGDIVDLREDLCCVSIYLILIMIHQILLFRYIEKTHFA